MEIRNLNIDIYKRDRAPYSPELNPVERFWLFIKSQTIRNKIYESLQDLEIQFI